MPPTDDIQRSLGKLEGQLTMLIESHEQLKTEVSRIVCINGNCQSLIDQRKDIEMLKNSRSMLIGMAMTISMLATIAIEWARHKMFP